MLKFVPITSYERLYEINQKGDVRTVPRKSKDSLGRIHNRKSINRKQKTTVTGYKSITLISSGRFRTHFIHRLVYEAFVGELKDKQVNHKNGNKADNRVINLEAVSGHENIQHAWKLGLMKIRRGHTFKKTTLNDKQRASIVASESSNASLAKRYKVNVKTIYNIKRRAAHLITH